MRTATFLTVLAMLPIGFSVHAEVSQNGQTNGLIEGSYIVTFKASTDSQPSLIIPPSTGQGLVNGNPPPFGEHSTGQSKEALAATLGISGQVVSIFETINAAHIRMDAMEADRLRHHPQVLSVEQDRILTIQTIQTDPGGVPGRLDQSAASLNNASSAFSADYPVYDNGLLTLPRVDTFDQVGKYQDATFQLTPPNTWELSGLQILGTRKLEPAPVSGVEVIKTGTLPVSVYLRASGLRGSCGFSGPGRIHQRLQGMQFDVEITAPHTDAYVNNEIYCAAVMTSFKMTVPLQVYGLSAGTYSYNVNGIAGTFSLDSDNKYPDDCDVASNTQCQ